FVLEWRVLLLFFFFSSRRRHTRFSRDWSSDVCSSDLPLALLLADEIGTHLEQFGQFLRAVVGAAEQLLGGRVIADSHRAPRFRRDLSATPTPSQNARHRHSEHRRRPWSRGRFGSRSRLRQTFALPDSWCRLLLRPFRSGVRGAALRVWRLLCRPRQTTGLSWFAGRARTTARIPAPR